jgi:hypothetical protein
MQQLTGTYMHSLEHFCYTHTALMQHSCLFTRHLSNTHMQRCARAYSSLFAFNVFDVLTLHTTAYCSSKA